MNIIMLLTKEDLSTPNAPFGIFYLGEKAKKFEPNADVVGIADGKQIQIIKNRRGPCDGMSVIEFANKIVLDNNLGTGADRSC